MARFNAQGIDGIVMSMQKFEEIPDGVVEGMLDEAGKVVVSAQKEQLKQLNLVRTGTLLSSIKAFAKAGSKKNDFRRYVIVYPAGKRGTYKRRLKVKFGYATDKRKGRRYKVGGDVKPVYNNDVAFVHEYGAPKRGIKAKQWIRTANEKCADEMTQAEYKIYSNWLDSLGL